MKKKILLSLMLLLFTAFTTAFANPNNFEPKRFDSAQMKQFDAMLNERLKITPEQKTIISKNHSKYKKEIDKIFDEMKKEQIKIRNVYMTGIPQYQANLRTSGSKARLFVLKQQAHNLRIENRKNFEKVLTEEQRLEFEKIKQELREKRHNPNFDS